MPAPLAGEAGLAGTGTDAMHIVGSYKLITHPFDPRHYPAAVLARPRHDRVRAVETRPGGSRDPLAASPWQER
jgi:hypothetical protein